MLTAASLPSSSRPSSGKNNSKRVHFVRAFRELLELRARYKGYHGGRGSGKTNNFAGALVLLASQRKNVILCCREIQRSITDSSKQIIEDKIDEYGLRHRFHSTQNEVICENGSRFLFRGLSGPKGSIRSLEGVDIVWIDEAQHISTASLEELKNTIRKPGSEI